MEQFEIRRYRAALAAFSEAFERGYADGEQRLARGEPRQDDVPEVFPIDVDRDKILDDVWHAFVPMFEDAGRTAAMAAKRAEDARLEEPDTRDDAPLVFDEHLYRWRVFLNPKRSGRVGAGP